MEGISVVICCFNSALRLPETLNRLVLQKLSDEFPWEVIIVNNNSTDNTKEVAAEVWSSFDSNIPFTIIDEVNPGLSYARAKGVEFSKYDYIIFCDDDNLLGETYVQNAFQIMNARQDVGILGGKINPFFESQPPKWFENFQYAYAVGSQGEQCGDISSRRFVWGAGMVIRKTIFNYIKKNNFFSLLSDRKGNILSSGGDAELCTICLILNYKLWYSNELELLHFIPSERLKWNYLLKLIKGFGIAEGSSIPMINILKIKEKEVINNSKISWKRESFSSLLLLLRHPKKVVKGLILKEGSVDVLWFVYYWSKFVQIVKMRKRLEMQFDEYYKIFKKKIVD